MLRRIWFETKVPIRYKGNLYDGIVNGTAYIEEYIYGEDRDGNRGEKRYDIDQVEFSNIVIEVDDEREIFITREDIENMRSVEQKILDDNMDKLN